MGLQVVETKVTILIYQLKGDVYKEIHVRFKRVDELLLICSVTTYHRAVYSRLVQRQRMTEQVSSGLLLLGQSGRWR